MTQFMKRLCAALTLTICFFVATDQANAQNPRRGYGVGVAAGGTDMWTQAMSGLRLFTPHRDDCNATTEVFVKVYTNSNSIDFGFCIDKDEHSAGSVEWEDAKHECLEDGKRLPEPGEWKFACQGATGLNNMTNSYEWASNFSYFDKPVSDWRIASHVVGNGSCKYGTAGVISSSTSVSGVFAFRCVR